MRLEQNPRYLVNQFISARSNNREDQYGGSLHNRLRFLREVVAGVAEGIDKEKVGVRFAPLFSSTDEERTYLGMVEDDPHTTGIEAIKVLEDVGIANPSIAEADWDNAPRMPESFRRAVRSSFSGADHLRRLLHCTKRYAVAGFRTGRPCRFWPYVHG